MCWVTAGASPRVGASSLLLGPASKPLCRLPLGFLLALHCWGYWNVLGWCLGDPGGFTQPWPAACPKDCCRASRGGPAPFPPPLDLAGSASGGDSQPHQAGLVFFFSLVFNEPTLEDLERHSCSSAVTYLPASAPIPPRG